MDNIGGVRPRTGKPSFQPSLGSGATQNGKSSPPTMFVNTSLYISLWSSNAEACRNPQDRNLMMNHHPTDSGTMNEAAGASWEGFKPGRPKLACLTSARGLSCMTRQGIEARWRATPPWRATTRPREASGGKTSCLYWRATTRPSTDTSSPHPSICNGGKRVDQD